MSKKYIVKFSRNYKGITTNGKDPKKRYFVVPNIDVQVLKPQPGKRTPKAELNFDDEPYEDPQDIFDTIMDLDTNGIAIANRSFTILTTVKPKEIVEHFNYELTQFEAILEMDPIHFELGEKRGEFTQEFFDSASEGSFERKARLIK